jgi:dihydroorotase
MTTQTLTLRRPDDWHTHLRDGPMLASVVNHTARQFRRAIAMPNLAPPVTTWALGQEYRQRILAAADPAHNFEPLITCYLTDSTNPDDLEEGAARGIFTAAKLYPAHATTNSSHGVTNIRHIHRVLARMEKIGLPLLLHGEVTHPEIDIFDREAAFIDQVYTPLLKDFPALRTVFEHITTEQAVQFVEAGPDRLAATITPHHLHLNRNALFEGGLRPHAYCLPVAKREPHRLALRKAATSGNPKFFLGTDTAPHAVPAKESACGCAGIFCAPHALESYAAVFEAENALDKFEAFASLNGPTFYNLPPNEERIQLQRVEQKIPDRLDLPAAPLIPFHAGETLAWRFAGIVEG